MPTLHWLNKDKTTKEGRKTPYRLLESKPEFSHGDEASENMIIQGNNLDALKSLLPYYANKVKCVYIDPPYNTKNAFAHYDDNLEHAKWLDMIYPRLELLRGFLSEDGVFYVQIDDKEGHYLKVILDEVFGRSNFVSSISVKMSTASGVKVSHKEKSIIKEKENIFLYAKNKECIKFFPQYIPKLDWDNEFQYYLEKNSSNDVNDWKVALLKDVLNSVGINFDPSNTSFQDFIVKNADKIWRRAFIRNEHKEQSQQNPNMILRDKKGNLYYRGRQMYFLEKKFNVCFTEYGDQKLPSHLLGDLWNDINTSKLFNEGGIEFRNGKKPEFLIARILKLATKENDLVLDSFLGSGTTAAVAHKMNRRYIGIEMGEHAKTHCVERLKKVIDGEQGGISKAVKWQGGGGFKFYELGEEMFDVQGKINPNIKFEHLAAHIWFSETKTPLNQNKISSPLLGVYNGVAYYLLYNGILGDKRPNGGNVLTNKILSTLDAYEGQKVIYGETSRIGSVNLAKKGVVFKQTPYDIQSR
ncbi:MAG: site-specific DNA-methyltransferase [Rickettsiales bacterium]|nr:site-specific DNA-methyltransferase [Rickettsiales bacterium]